MPLPPPPCFYCTLQNGIYISKEDGTVQSLRNDHDKFINATCPERFQCVGHTDVVPLPNLGCCLPCSFEQACAESTISLQHPFTDNICPDGHLCRDHSVPEPCLEGDICKYNIKVDCETVQKNATGIGIGVIFDGAYCAGSALMNNCPTGYYCPTAREKITCPAGFFCPMKTKIPQIQCPKCAEGSKERVRDNSTAMYFFGFLVFVPMLHYIGKLVIKLFQNYGLKSTESQFQDISREIPTFTSEYLSKDFLGVEVRYVNISLTLRGNMSKDTKIRSKCILNNISGKLSPKRLCAILGESGTGKSSLLKLLSGRGYCNGNIMGSVFINNVEFRGAEWNCSSVGKGSFKSILAFIPQDDDIVFSELTVFQNLYWAGRFHLSAFASKEEIEILTNKVMSDLALEHVQNVQVGDMYGGISGGERRRVSIGIAVMSKPRVLLCDEVTSGLDSSNSMMVIAMLKKLAHEHNMSVLCSIHQPRQQIFSLIDDLVLMCKGGNVLFSGEATNAITYFNNIGCAFNPILNPADILLDLSTGNAYSKSGQRMTQHELCSRWTSHYEHSYQGIDSTADPKTKVNFDSYHHPMPSYIQQFCLQLSRQLLFCKRNIKEKIIDTIIIALGSAVMSSVEGIFPLVDENAEYPIPFEYVASKELPLVDMYTFSIMPIKPKLNFALKISTVCGVLVAFAASRTISSKKGHVHHEFASGYIPSSYLVAISIISTIEHGFQMMLAGAVSYWIVQPLQPLLFYMATFFMIGFVMSGWGHLFALLIPIENLTLTSGAILLCLNLLYSGVTKPATFEDIYTDRSLAIISGFLAPSSRYFVETLVVSELQCFPEQYGFAKSMVTSSALQEEAITVSKVDRNHLLNFTVMDHLNLAMNDKEASLNPNCDGWYYNFPHFIITGVILRVISLIFIHFIHQNRRDIFQAFFKKKGYDRSFILYLLFLVLLLISLVNIAIVMILP